MPWGRTTSRPKQARRAQWTSPLAGGETNGPADLAAWWKNFGDTNLDSLMTVAVQSNLTLRIAEAHVREARAERDVVVRRFVAFSGNVRVPIPGIVLAPNNFPPLPALAFRWITIFTTPVSTPHGNSIFSAARGEPSKPPTPESARRNTASATCWFRCSRKSRGITSRRAATSNASPSRAKTSKSNRKS